MKRIIYVFLIGISSSYLNVANASVIDRSPVENDNVASAAINTQSANTLKHGAVWLGLRNDYYNLQQFSNAQLINDAAQNNRNIESNAYYNFTSLTAAYGLRDTITIGASLPFAQFANIRTGYAPGTGEPLQGTVSNLGTSQGIGDLTLFAQWLMLRTPSQLSAMLVLGSSVPTGADYLRDNNGNLFPPGDQPGRGTLAPYMGLAVTKKMDKSSVSANLFYTQSLNGAQNTKLGNAINYNFAYVRRLYQSNSNFTFDGSMELNGGYYSKNTTAGVAGPDSGGRMIVLTPGFRMTTPSKISPYISASLPIMQSLNGIQSKLRFVITCGINMSI